MERFRTCQSLKLKVRHKLACWFVCLGTSGARVVIHVEAPSTGVTVATENKAQRNNPETKFMGQRDHHAGEETKVAPGSAPST